MDSVAMALTGASPGEIQCITEDLSGSIYSGTRSGVDRLDPETTLHNRAADWRRLKMLVLDSVSSPITKRHDQ